MLTTAALSQENPIHPMLLYPHKELSHAERGHGRKRMCSGLLNCCRRKGSVRCIRVASAKVLSTKRTWKIGVGIRGMVPENDTLAPSSQRNIEIVIVRLEGVLDSSVLIFLEGIVVQGKVHMAAGPSGPADAATCTNVLPLSPAAGLQSN